MCGRFRVARSKEILEDAFGAEDCVDWGTDNDTDDDADEAAQLFPGLTAVGPSIDSPRYNVAPAQDVLAVRQDATGGRRELRRLRWGLIPAFAGDAASGYKMINARSESAAERPAFREALRLRRCLIPADGFYEWKRVSKEKLPFCFTLADDSLFAFAGLWERWRGPHGKPVESCTILTTTANELVQEIHDRMPVILAPGAYDLWLDPGFTRVAELKPLLSPYPAAAMRRYRVSPRVNQVKNDDPECAAAIDAA